MKTSSTIATMIGAVALSLCPPAHAADDTHDHAHAEKKAGPNGGRIVTSVEPHFELLVMKDRKLKLTFLGENGKAIAPEKQSVTGTGGSRSNPTKFVFTKTDGTLVSDKALPEGKVVALILRVKTSPDAKTVTERISLNLADCPGCEHLEYACTCTDH